MPHVSPSARIRAGRLDLTIRAALRALAVLVYCFGAVIAPTLHQAFHDDHDHIHVGDSITFLPHHHDHDDDADDDDHDDDHHSHHHDHHDDHGAASLWHFGTALGDQLDRVPAVAAAGVVDWFTAVPRAEQPRAAHARLPRLRGPPQCLPV